MRVLVLHDLDGRGLPHPLNACIMNMLMSVLLLTLRLVPSTYGKGEQLSRAYASPLNVDPKLDCALKELAWEYAKKLLPRVSFVKQIIDLHTLCLSIVDCYIGISVCATWPHDWHRGGGADGNINVFHVKLIKITLDLECVVFDVIPRPLSPFNDIC